MKHFLLLTVFGYINAFLVDTLFNQQPGVVPSISQCHLKPADLIFVLDGSGSVGSRNFYKMLDFVKTFVNEFEISDQYVQIGIITYSDRAHEIIQLHTGDRKHTLMREISQMSFPDGNTNTADALRTAMEHGFTKSHGDRDYVTNVMMVITDGGSSDQSSTLIQANKVHSQGIKTFAIGVGNRVSKTEMNEIASDNAHVFHVSNFDALNTLKEELRNKTCEDIMFSMLFCQNNIPNCTSYGHGVCVSYAQWARYNCPLFCGYCSAQGSPPPPTTLKTGTTTSNVPTPPAPMTIGECRDSIPNCALYTSSMCVQYVDWSRQNCPLFCGHCKGPHTPPIPPVKTTSLPPLPSTTLGATPCKNNIPNCINYGSSVCGQYAEWSKQNCALFCGICQGPPSPPSPITTGGVPIPPSPPSKIKECRDTFDSCSSYGPTVCGHYIEWSRSSCAQYCGFCTGQSTSSKATLWVSVSKSHIH